MGVVVCGVGGYELGDELCELYVGEYVFLDDGACVVVELVGLVLGDDMLKLLLFLILRGSLHESKYIQ